MSESAQLPAEVWNLVLRLLSLSDRLRLRATCRHFRELVDHSGLWRDWTVELRRRQEEYEEHLWLTLRRWRVTSARLTSALCALISKELPGLTSLIVDDTDCSQDKQLQDLKCFTHLEQLHLLETPVRLEELFLFLPPRLRRLRLCHISAEADFTLPAEIRPDSPFQKLTSLVLHFKFRSHPVEVLHFFLCSLPQLQHLSLLIDTDVSLKSLTSDLAPLRRCRLSSLELVDGELVNLPKTFYKLLRALPRLRSLAIICDTIDVDGDDSARLALWLKHLPALTDLLLKCSSVVDFVESIPSSVTRLTLLPLLSDSEELTLLSTRLQNLQHLHLLLPLPDDLGSDTALIPQLFPGLRTLSLSFQKVPEEALLSLASLEQLEVLETLDSEPLPAELVSKLRELTNNRVQIFHKPEASSLLFCRCMFMAEYWP